MWSNSSTTLSTFTPAELSPRSVQREVTCSRISNIQTPDVSGRVRIPEAQRMRSPRAPAPFFQGDLEGANLRETGPGPHNYRAQEAFRFSWLKAVDKSYGSLVLVWCLARPPEDLGSNLGANVKLHVEIEVLQGSLQASVVPHTRTRTQNSTVSRHGGACSKARQGRPVCIEST